MAYGRFATHLAGSWTWPLVIPLTVAVAGVGDTARAGGGGLTTRSERLSGPIVGLAGALSGAAGTSRVGPLVALFGDNAASDGAAAAGVAVPDVAAAAPAFFFA